MPAPLSVNVENLYLKDNATAGTTWVGATATITNPAPLTITLTNTLMEKDLSRSVNGVAYTNVIHVKSALTIAGLPFVTSDMNYYYAPRVGLIENHIIITTSAPLPPLNIDTQTKLKTVNF